jgi:hypothetical protein
MYTFAKKYNKMTKKTIILAVIVFQSFFASIKAQNIFPTTAGSNVGIGTTSPTSKLQVVTGDVKIDAGKLIIGPGAGGQGIVSQRNIVVDAGGAPGFDGSIDVRYISGSINTTVQLAVAKCNGCAAQTAVLGDAIIRGNSAGSFIIANENAGDIKFETQLTNTAGASKIQMRIDNSGNVGIGTGSSPIAPGEKLAVNGFIHAKEVKVDLIGWPDFVFAKNYNLPTLQTVEKQIIDNGHLSNIPSAAEVEKEGLLLGDINKKLLQKVEELTLYLIQQNKEILQLKDQVKILVAKSN